MPHQSGHVVIDFATPINSEKPMVKVWHCAIVLVAIGFVIGALVF